MKPFCYKFNKNICDVKGSDCDHHCSFCEFHISCDYKVNNDKKENIVYKLFKCFT